ASEDRGRAQMLATVLSNHGWSVWWDRKIPLGKSYDEVIENALAQAKCVIVLWSAVSVASEWVRNEASEGRRRQILVPVFIEPVDAPLAFRLLNGANLIDWQLHAGHQEFDKLTERVTELLGLPASQPADDGGMPPVRTTKELVAKFFRSRLARGGLATAFVALLAMSYVLTARRPEPERIDNIEADRPRDPVSKAPSPPSRREVSDFENSIRDLSKIFGGAVPATSMAKGFHVPDLGMRIAFITEEQSAATLGSLPPGAVVMEVESGRPVARAGLHVGDVMVAIGGKKIASEDDLRQAIFKIGPGKTAYSYRRGAETKTVSIDCAKCEAQ
ncbi:MAG TPA: TIR domain-containing protein, partial [Candidatus Binatia bacterium]|nr:TIR domain-containing protein [Candidatus Binatia bacterium]